tara:strand:+ start:1279 stop:2568 length:1290 start_codon:yes stop_codon:yes gene_type:complete
VETDKPRIVDIFLNLISPSTLPHVLLLAFSGAVFYLLSASDSDTLFAIGISGYIGLSMGYALTAWLNHVGIVHKYSHFQSIDGERPVGKRGLVFIANIFSTWVSPISLGLIPFLLIAIFLNTEMGAQQLNYWAMALGGLFVIWSLAQGRALAKSLQIFVESRAVKIAALHKKSSNLTATSAHMLVIAIFAAITYWILVLSIQEETDIGLLQKLGPVIFAVFAVLVQLALFRYTRKRRIIDSQRNDTASFSFSWGLLMQVFVTWHLLSAYRRFVNDEWGVGLVIEELILMLFTVIAAIWSLARDSHLSGFKLFRKDNAIFWGLSFGIAYSGSIAMISVLGAKLTDGTVGTIGMSSSIGIGHLVTAGTMLWIHSWSTGNIAKWLDIAKDEVGLVSDVEEDLPEKKSETKNDGGAEDIVELDIPPPVTSENS